MDYKLALRLKDAGVPGIKDIEVGAINYPTLSELIDACDSLEELRLHFSKHYLEDDKWVTAPRCTVQCIAFNKSYSIEVEQLSAKGKTPEEAVAKLYLKLKG